MSEIMSSSQIEQVQESAVPKEVVLEKEDCQETVNSPSQVVSESDLPVVSKDMALLEKSPEKEETQSKGVEVEQVEMTENVVSEETKPLEVGKVDLKPETEPLVEQTNIEPPQSNLEINPQEQIQDLKTQAEFIPQTENQPESNLETNTIPKETIPISEEPKTMDIVLEQEPLVEKIQEDAPVLDTNLESKKIE